MKRWIRNTGAALLALALAGGAALLVAAELGERKMHRQIGIETADVPFGAGTASVERGRYLFMSRGCAVCHGADGAGKDVINDGKGMLIHAPNITSAAGAPVAGYRSIDWVRTIRHGVKPDGEPLAVMPSEDYNRLTDADLAALVAFVRQLPPAEGPGATIRLPRLVKALYAAGVVRDAAEKIDHSLAPSLPVPEAATPEHGAYVANACIGCHGATLSGGRIPGAPPDWPAAANLHPGPAGALAKYQDAQAFAEMLRTGRRPDGSAVSAVMPFGALKELNETDVQALYIYLNTLPSATKVAQH